MARWTDHVTDPMEFENLHIRIKRALSAMENRRCLEIYYPEVTWTLEVHAVGQNSLGIACVLGYAIFNAAQS
jgi:hypothetical protein